MKRFFLLIFGLIPLWVSSQNVPIGTWRTHLPYNRATTITSDGTTQYCGTLSSLFAYNSSTGHYERYTKTEGFSGVGVSRVAYHKPSQTLIIAYDDANIDLLYQDEVYNLSQIKTFSIQGSKKINNITFKGDTAILSCDFGVVFLDVRNRIFKTDVKFSDNLSFSSLNCHDAAFMNGYYYFATSGGVFRVHQSDEIKNLLNWTQINAFGVGPYGAMEVMNNMLYVSYSGLLAFGLNDADTLFSFDGMQKTVLFPGHTKVIYDLHAANNQLVILNEDELRVINTAGSIVWQKAGCFDRARQATMDNSGSVWIADNVYGAFHVNPSTCQIYVMDGPFTFNVFDIEISQGIIWCAAGALNVNFNNAYNIEGLYYRRDNDWKALYIPDFGYPEQTLDVIDIAIDPNDPLHVYAASWGMGLFEIQNYTVINQLVAAPLQTSLLAGFEYKIGGVAFDHNNNLWLSNAHTTAPLKVKKTNNSWSVFGMGSNAPTSNAVVKVEIDDLNHIWVSVVGKGVSVLNPESGASRLLTNIYNQGDLPNVNVRAIACDKNGEMWIGTDDGIRVFSPSQVFSSSNINGQKIVIKNADGNNELLLGETMITDIEVDGANRKWISTFGNGVRLVSENGKEILYSFTTDNSPLLSNNVHCIGIDHQTGEVFFGTELGLVSFRAEATQANNSFGQVYAYPNPVKHDYKGVITIAGMAERATVKITDVSGNLVYETESLGGQAIWDGKKFDGSRVQTGVYLVFCTNRDASETVITKILFIN